MGVTISEGWEFHAHLDDLLLLEVTGCAERLVADVIAIDSDLFTIKGEGAVDDATIEHGFAATATNGLELLKRVGYF